MENKYKFPEVSRDRLWKGIIEDCFDEVLLYFYPEECGRIDMARGFDFLDKELEQLFPDAGGKDRVADKLVRAYLRDGSEAWFLVHVEVQGYHDAQFPWRMYQYFFRIMERYGQPVTALALITHAEAAGFVHQYRYDFMGTWLIYNYRSVRLVEKSAETYAEDPRLFGAVMAAARKTLDRGLDDAARLAFLKELSVRLLQRDYSKEQIRHIFTFLQCYTRFDEADSREAFTTFSNDLIIKSKPMGIIEVVREHILAEVREEGREEGRQEGREEGREEGRQEGREEGRQEGREEGRQEGREEARQELLDVSIKALDRAGLPAAQIAEYLDLSIEAVESRLAGWRGENNA